MLVYTRITQSRQCCNYNVLSRVCVAVVSTVRQELISRLSDSWSCACLCRSSMEVSKSATV